jgi:hypothetical protein
MNRSGGSYPVFNRQTSPFGHSATNGGEQRLAVERRHVVHDVTQYDKIKGGRLVPGNVLDRLPQEGDAGTIPTEEPADPWG